MNKQRVVIMLFVLVALVQLAVPVKMIWSSEDIITHGERHLFKLMPVDPYDPFRGKYITLRFEIEQYSDHIACNTENKKDMYVRLTKDSAGYSIVQDISILKPTDKHYFISEVYCYTDPNGKSNYSIMPSFNKYYMKETLAQGAENLTRRNQLDQKKDAYAEVYIANGDVRIKQVFIGDQEIETIVKQSLNK